MAESGNSRILRTISLLIVICLAGSAAQAQYGGGTGEPNNPYLIATAEDLMLLGDSLEDYDKHFILTADIDLDPNLPGRKVFDEAVIGYFKGVFDGNDHSILHLMIKGSGHLGLFRRLASGAEVRDVKVVDVNIVGIGFGVGGLVGYNGGDLTNCFASGTVSSTGGEVGGLVGQNFGHVMACYSTGTVSGKWFVGGLVGENLGHVTACYSMSGASGSSIIGGLVGANGTDAAIRGGPGTITDCYSTGQANAADGIVGGLVGSNTAGTVTRCYSTGAVVGNHEIGGLVGSNRDAVIQCFWDIQTSLQTISAGGAGKTSVELQRTGTFLIWGTCGNEGTWTINEDNDYPALWWENKIGEPITVGASLYGLLTGEGVQDNPYLIYTSEELNLIGLFPCDWDKHFKLMADIDLSDFDGKQDRPAFNIIGSGRKSRAGVPFTGVFDGNGYKIANFTYTLEEEAENVGLFGCIADANAQIKNVGLVDPNVDAGTQRNVGCLAGSLKDGSVTGCYVEGGIVKGESNVGGLVGYNDRGSIATCHSIVTVNEADDHVGGLVGVNWYGSITKSYSSGRNRARIGRVGGLVGYNDRGSIATSYSTGTVDGEEEVGGLVGANEGGNITSSYSTDIVKGNIYVGGLVGVNWHGSITSSYNTGPVIGSEDVGGMVGDGSPATVTHSVWDTQTSVLSESVGGVGLTTAEMMDPYMLGLNGFANDPNWVLDAGRDYPRLAWEGTPGSMIPEPDIDWLEGQGTEEQPYCIETAGQLIHLRRASGLWDKNYILISDINLDPNLSGREIFSQALIKVFSGFINGSDHTISHLTIEGQNYLGLFGQLKAGAEVRGLGLVNVNIAGSGKFIGGLVGENCGDIVSCYVTGTVSGGYWFVGGLAGKNYDGGITKSYSSCTVTGNWGGVGGLVGYNAGGNITSSYSTNTVTGDWNYVGGLVGYNAGGNITSSYSTGKVTGRSHIGGLVGINIGSVVTSYSTGMVTGNGEVGGLVGENHVTYRLPIVYGNTLTSFWDIETSGQSTSVGGIGKNTSEMQTAGTFLNADWDFVDETENGTEDIWWINEGQDYPRLWWEASN
ncbi:MAG: GLUG motif-containing protein [Planctomycetota bacterium]